MTCFALDQKERRTLEDLCLYTDDAHILRRTLALLWLDEGEEVQEVAAYLQVSRQSVYNWATRFQMRGNLPLCARMADGARSGRPCSVCGIIDPLIEEVIEQDPRERGYRATVWTAGLLEQYLWEEHQIDVSRRSVGLAIARLRFRWKRPRHHLARRPATWRQAKGGSSGAWQAASVRSS
jgi:transposase